MDLNTSRDEDEHAKKGFSYLCCVEDHLCKVADMRHRSHYEHMDEHLLPSLRMRGR